LANHAQEIIYSNKRLFQATLKILCKHE